MTHRVSEATKLRQHRGLGHGAAYIPWIFTSEVPGHKGTHHNPVDWKTGRTVHLLSDGELYLYQMLRWDDNVRDIREQFPVPIEATYEISQKYKGFRHPRDNEGLIHMTVDLLVDYYDGMQRAFSVKVSRSDFEKHPNQIKHEYIMKEYWEGQEKSEFHMVFTNEMNRNYADNIGQVVFYWQPNTVTDKVSLFKFLVAHKQIKIDMESGPVDALDFYNLANQYIPDSDTELLIKKIKDIPKMLPTKN